jgi:hypothetical protein
MERYNLSMVGSFPVLTSPKQIQKFKFIEGERRRNGGVGL